MPIPPAVQPLLDFLELDVRWVQHLLDENYLCGCSKIEDFSFAFTYCEKWQSKIDLDRAKGDLQRAQRRYDDARLTAKP